MHTLDLLALPILARLSLVVMFPFSALDKVVHWKEAMQQASSSFIPGASFLLILAIVVETLAPICIVVGWHDRLAAFFLAGFCAVTALLYHAFWKFPQFWSKAGEGRSHFWDFLKNFGLVGGLLLVMIGGSPVSASYVASHPASSAPYAADAATSSSAQ